MFTSCLQQSVNFWGKFRGLWQEAELTKASGAIGYYFLILQSDNSVGSPLGIITELVKKPCDHLR